MPTAGKGVAATLAASGRSSSKGHTPPPAAAAAAKRALKLALAGMYSMQMKITLEFMRALIVIVCGAQIVAPPQRSPSVNMFVSVGVYFYDFCEFTNAPVVGVLFVSSFAKQTKKTNIATTTFLGFIQLSMIGGFGTSVVVCPANDR
jgi:hypothetical protein